MIRKPVLSLDVDDVLRCQLEEIIKQAKILFSADLTLEDFSVWDAPLGHKCGITDDQFNAWAWGNPDVAISAPPKPFMLDAVDWLSYDYEIVITTATGAPEATELWLRRLGLKYPINFTGDKATVDFDLHIDDSASQIEKISAAGRNVVKFVSPQNGHINHVPKMSSWLDTHVIGMVLARQKTMVPVGKIRA